MKHKIAQYLTLEEKAILLEQPDRRKLQGLRDYCILKLMFIAGPRRAEVCSLKQGSLKTEGKELWLYILGKGNRERRVPIEDVDFTLSLEKYHSVLRKKLKKWFLDLEHYEHPEAPMFFKLKWFKEEGPRGITPETIRFVVDKYVRLSKIDKHLTAHSLRHSFATHALQGGADVATVRALMGHRSIQTTNRYLHSSDKLMRAAVARLSS